MIYPQLSFLSTLYSTTETRSHQNRKINADARVIIQPNLSLQVL